MKITQEMKLYAALAGAALLVLLIIKKKISDVGGLGAVSQGLTAGVVGVAGDVASGVVTGTVLGVGDAVGVPRTDETECEKAMREGRTWDASFACPAGTFLKWEASKAGF